MCPSALCVEASTNSSQEHQLRRFVFTDYDKNVRPVLDPTKATDVEFGIDISKLVKVVSTLPVLFVFSDKEANQGALEAFVNHTEPC